MTTVRRFTCDDLFTFNHVNLDVLTETYGMGFYLSYMAKWPDLFTAMESPSGRTMAYIIGKAEGEAKNWHGHVSAVTVAPEYRRLGLARRLMADLERISDDVYKGHFVDLFVRKSNALAIGMYKTLGYTVYREVVQYYSGQENAYDMRKALSLDPDKESMVPLKHPVHASDV